MEAFPSAIQKFLQKQKVASLATTNNGLPYCCNVFYAFDAENLQIIFKSDKKTFHIQNALEQPYVSGTVYKTSSNILGLKGVQFFGKMLKPRYCDYERAAHIYYGKYPFAKAKEATLWVVELEYAKMINNKLGFGNKIEWKNQLVES